MNEGQHFWFCAHGEKQWINNQPAERGNDHHGDKDQNKTMGTQTRHIIRISRFAAASV